MAMFDPVYVTEVLNDILGRRGLELIMTPKETKEVSDGENMANRRPCTHVNGQEIKRQEAKI